MDQIAKFCLEFDTLTQNSNVERTSVLTADVWSVYVPNQVEGDFRAKGACYCEIFSSMSISIKSGVVCSLSLKQR